MRNTMSSPPDIWSFSYNGNISNISNLNQLTNENKDILKSVELGIPEIYYFRGAKGDVVQLWLLRPIGWSSSKTWPLVQLIHGGPQGYFGDSWGWRWNAQLWASRGYAVSLVNFHGSTGFGQRFTNDIFGNWGSYPFIDIMNATDFLLEKFTWIDRTKLSACGASYGGYMINWILGNTDRFNSLVCHDGLFDTLSSYYSTDELFFPEWEFKGTPWDNPKLYDMWNPSNLVANWKTPTLVIHGGRDYRVDLSQGLGTFTALQRLGIPSEFLYFPQENHFVSNPMNSIKWYNTVLDWLDKWNV